jgi:hypothetical protein
MTPEEKKRAIADALKILKPSPEQREACRRDIAHVLDQLDRGPEIGPYERMLKRGEFLRRAARINRTFADGDTTMALPQSLLDELVESDKKLRAIHKTLSPDRWRKPRAVIAAYFLLLRWRIGVKHSPRGDWVQGWVDLPSTKDGDWYRLSATLYGKLTKDGKPTNLRGRMGRLGLCRPGLRCCWSGMSRESWLMSRRGIRKGNLRGLAVTAAKRSAALPDEPTMAKAGIPDQEAETINGLMHFLIPGRWKEVCLPPPGSTFWLPESGKYLTHLPHHH